MFWLYFQWFLSQIPMFHFSMYACTATGHTHAYIVNSIIWPRPWTSDPSIKSQHSKIRFRCVICWSGWGIPPIEGIILKKNSSDAKILDRIKKGEIGFFSGSLGWPSKGNTFCKVWIGLLLPDQSYTSRMKGSGLYFSTNTWTFTISSHQISIADSISPFHWERFKSLAPQVDTKNIMKLTVTYLLKLIVTWGT